MLNIDIKPQKGILFIKLSGILNQNTLARLKREVTGLVKEAGIRNIIFNLNDLEEIDYEGINELLYNYNYCKKNLGEALFVSSKENPYLSNYLNNVLVKDEGTARKLINI